jgi:hypothetical protein
MPLAAGAAVGSGLRRKRPHKYLCGVPAQFCTGSNSSVSSAFKHNAKLHGSSEDAAKCYGKYLIKQGYKQVGSREYAPPDGGPIHVLTKKCRFGSRFRGGKADRQMPQDMVGGTIISC